MQGVVEVQNVEKREWIDCGEAEREGPVPLNVARLGQIPPS
jgi:hypothetical protein